MKLTPCQSPDRDPDDWFIEKDGRQYRDEPVLTQAEVDAVVVPLAEDNEVLDGEEADAAIAKAEQAKIKQNLIKRRKAKEACHFECAVRLQCLQARLETRMGSGTWGGYFPEELDVLQRGIDARSNRRL